MRSKFVSELQAMHEDLIQMASLAETAISSSVKALETMDEPLAQKVVGSDHQIDERAAGCTRSAQCIHRAQDDHGLGAHRRSGGGHR